jgi:propionate CoA-transferase
MALKKVISADDAVALVRDGDIVASSGYGGNGNPEALFAAIERRFLVGNGPRSMARLLRTCRPKLGTVDCLERFANKS